MGGWTGMGGEVVSFWDAGLRTGWAARGGGYRGTRGGQAGQPIDEVSRKEEEFQKKKKKSCRANDGRSCDACARTRVHKACIFSRYLSTVTYLVLLLAR